MKIIQSLLICILTTLSIQLNSQLPCGTVQNEAFFERLEKNRKVFENPSNQKSMLRFVPVQFHMVGNSQGIGAPDRLSVLQALCTLNERFEDTELRFYNAGMTIVNNSAIYNDTQDGVLGPSLGSNQLATNNMQNLRNPNAANIWIVKYAGGGAGGYYTGNRDWVVINNNTLSNDGYTLEHEMGHFFSLPHTHFGWEGNIGDGIDDNDGYLPSVHGDTVTILQIGSSQSNLVDVELVDGSNCTTAGDRICDTPPDYGFGQSCSCCSMIYNVWDRNFDKIEPMIDNVMSYSNGCNPYRFSPMQSDAMVADYDSNDRAYLRFGTVSNYTPVTEAPTILAPDFGLTENFNGVLFDWEDVENATEYVLEISGGPQKLSYILNDSEFFVTELEANSQYIWTVNAYGVFGGGCQQGETRILQTGAGISAVNDISEVNHVNIYPNPVSKGMDINIALEADKSFRANVHIYDITGRLVYSSNNQAIDNGTTKLTVPTYTLVSGLHILEIQSENGTITEKIIVE
mgnify:CR=1 FL=1